MNQYRKQLHTFKHKENNTFVHVQTHHHGQLFLLSKGLFDQYYFHLIPTSEGYTLVPIHNESHLFIDDFDSIVQVLSNLPVHYNINDILMNNNYIPVDTLAEPNIGSAMNMIGSSPFLNSDDMSTSDDWYYYGIMPTTQREMYRHIDSLTFKYDSPNSTDGMYANAILFQDPNGIVHYCDDSMINVTLPCPLFGNLINVIKVDHDGNCINNEEYQKYCELAHSMPLPQHKYRVPKQ